MPVTYSGMASGIDTDSIIKKLVAIEARPLKKWEDDKNTFRRKKNVLVKFKNHLKKISAATKDLYGFRSSYNEKKAISSNVAVAEATANKNAAIGTNNIEVQQIASIHKIATDSIDKKMKLPSGKFTIEVNGESKKIRFRSGRLQHLQKKIDEIASDLVSTKYINTANNYFILSIESKTPGEKGEIKISGDKNLLKKIGMIKGLKGERKEKVSLLFDKKFITSYIGEKKIKEPNGSIDVEKNGNSIKIKSILWQEYILPIEFLVKEKTLLKFSFLYKKDKIKEEVALPYNLTIGPEERTIIKGIELKGYNISRTRTIEKKHKQEGVIDVAGIGVVSVAKDKRIEKIYELDKNSTGEQVIPIGRDLENKKISKIIFYCNEGIAKFSKATIITPIKGSGIFFEPKNEITKARDAKIKIDKIEIKRDRNDNLDDIVKGISLNIKKKSKIPISIKIEPDIEKAIDKIKKFVIAYNGYLDYTMEITKAGITSKLGDYKKIKNKSGLFLGDMTILRLENTLKTAIGEAYPSMAKDPVRILSQVGISTGALNSSWNTIKEGKLIIDEEKLRKSIMNNPEGIKQFFGCDTDGDNREDNGLAFRINNILTPYILTGNSIITSKIALEENSIKMTDDRIGRLQDHLKKYEDKLRRKFAAMEKSISGANVQKNWMKSNLKGMQKQDN